MENQLRRLQKHPPRIAALLLISLLALTTDPSRGSADREDTGDPASMARSDGGGRFFGELCAFAGEDLDAAADGSRKGAKLAKRELREPQLAGFAHLILRQDWMGPRVDTALTPE
jgi:hypothetical protein